jgi:hypothetical protein
MPRTSLEEQEQVLQNKEVLQALHAQIVDAREHSAGMFQTVGNDSDTRPAHHATSRTVAKHQGNEHMLYNSLPASFQHLTLSKGTLHSKTVHIRTAPTHTPRASKMDTVTLFDILNDWPSFTSFRNADPLGAGTRQLAGPSQESRVLAMPTSRPQMRGMLVDIKEVRHEVLLIIRL